MASVNRVTLIGNLVADPESRYMPNGDCVCNIRLATSESWKDKATGEKKEVTEFHRVTIYRKLGEIAGQYLTKGAPVYFEGSLKTRKWQDKDGQDRYTTEIVATEMQMLGKREEGQGSQPAPRPSPAPQRNSQGAPPDDFDQEIPFAPHGRGIAGYSL